MYVIEYQPRTEDPIIIGRFSTLEKAEEHMEVIKQQRPKAAPHHTIKLETEHGGPKGPEPTRFNTWENKGREIDF